MIFVYIFLWMQLLFYLTLFKWSLWNLWYIKHTPVWPSFSTYDQRGHNISWGSVLILWNQNSCVVAFSPLCFWYLHFDNDEWPEASVITILSIQMQFMAHDIYRYLYRNQILSKNVVSVSSMCLYSRSLIDILKPDWHVIIWLAVCQELWINAAVCLAL